MRKIVFTLVAACLVTFVSAQTPCPDFANMIVLLDGESLSDLESPSVIAKQKKKGLYRGFDNSVRLEGVASPVKVSSSSSFVFRPMNPQIHPNQQVTLYPFEVNKDFRELVVGGTNMFGGSKNKSNQDNSIRLKFEKITDGCYLVTTTSKLAKGNYAFNLGNAGTTSVQGQGSKMFAGTDTGGQWYAFTIK